MRIISEKRLKEFCRRHAGAEASFQEWVQKVRGGEWKQFADVRAVFSSADQVTLKVRRRDPSGRLKPSRESKTVVIYNVGGNNYRIIASNNYQTGIVYILFTLTHAEYSKEEWKQEL